MKTTVILLSVFALARAGDNEWTPIVSSEPDRAQRSVAEPVYDDPGNDIAQPIQQVPTSYSERVAPVYIQQAIPYAVQTPVPVAVQIPVQVPNPVPYEVQVPVPVVRTIPVPVDKEVPYPVVREIPVPVVRHVEVPVVKPYPVPVPIYKTKVIDHGTRHTYEYPPNKGWW